MALAVDPAEARTRLNAALSGRIVDRVVCSINGWELRLQRKDDPHAVRLVGEEPRVPEESSWLEALAEPPFELELDSKQSDHDVAAALTVFTVLNDAKVEKAELGEDGTLQLHFEGERRLDFPGQVEQLVWAWKVEWGQLVMICKGGEFFSSHS